MSTEQQAVMIVRLFEALEDRHSEFSEDPEIERIVIATHERYGKLKRAHDFTTSSRMARAEAVTLLLKSFAARSAGETESQATAPQPR